MEIHAPRVGGDLTKLDLLEISIVFQSTPPVWGATFLQSAVANRMKISIHAPRVGGDAQGHGAAPHSPISIHAPRVGGDSSVSYSFPTSY